MSTKNLARTVIEGGRGRWSRIVRRTGHHSDRTLARQAVGRAYRDAGLDDLVLPAPRRGDTAFHDKLSAAVRWLNRQAGRPWDRVRSELFERFDTRTTAGRHILHCHMLAMVEDCRRWRPEFHVDARGVLRPRVWPGRTRPTPLPRPQRELEHWLAGRLVGERGQALFWFVPTVHGAFRQADRLDEDDARLWRSLPVCFQKHHRPFAPRS